MHGVLVLFFLNKEQADKKRKKKRNRHEEEEEARNVGAVIFDRKDQNPDVFVFIFFNLLQ